MFTEIRRHWFGWLVAAYLLYALAFIFHSSVVVDGRRYFLLHDDAMISMTYARNLAEGHGAVWFPGYEPVQGYSNPLWMLYMALVHLLPLPSSLMSLPIQLTGAALVAGTLVFVKRIAEQVSDDDPAFETTQSHLAPFIAVLLTAFYLPLNDWSLRGMEVGLLAFGIALATWAATGRARGSQRAAWLFPFLGLLTTVRMDAVVPGAVIVLWLAWTRPERRVRTIATGFAWLAMFLAAQLLIQKAYYHDWLPNTYYLKLSGIALTRRIPWGLYVLFVFAVGIGLWLFVPIAILAARRTAKTAWLLIALVVGQAAYSIYVGGDAWEWWGGANRYLCVVMPLFFVLVACSFELLFRSVFARAADAQRLTAAAMLAMGLLALLQTNSYQFWSSNSLKQWVLVDEPHELSDHGMMLRVALALEQNTTPRARVAVTWAGIVPYFSHRPPIDLLGKNDPKIARGPNRPSPPPAFNLFITSPVDYCWPGHTKRDFKYSIGELLPDVVQQWYTMDEAADILNEKYMPAHIGSENIYLKKDSREVAFKK